PPPYTPKPPYHPIPPVISPPTLPPKPPVYPSPPIVNPPTPPILPPPIVNPPTPPILPPPSPPIVNPPTPPIVKPPSPGTPCPPPPPPAQQTCPIDTLKLGACVDVLGGLVHIGIGSSAKDTCCPVLQGLLDLDAAICLCTTIKAKLLNINIIIPIALQVLIDCGKTPPPGFQCPAQ
ncbi:hypothetical protein Gohar_015020, partial [Gossypium harknessii]|nr:hypothetical protein [Gossypium harknessii]